MPVTMLTLNNMLDNQETFGQIESNGTGEEVYSNGQDDENTESNRNSAVPNFMPRILAEDDILESISSLNSKQRDLFNVVHNQAK